MERMEVSEPPSGAESSEAHLLQILLVCIRSNSFLHRSTNFSNGSKVGKCLPSGSTRCHHAEEPDKQRNESTA